MKEIIVIGGNHHNTLAILRSLGEKGVKSLLIVVSKDPKPYIGYSKYIQEMRLGLKQHHIGQMAKLLEVSLLIMVKT